MRRIIVIVLLLAAAGAGAGYWWWHEQRQPPPTELTLFGNIDLRQVQLAFNNSERISAVLVQEGDRVKKGEVLAELDTSRLLPQVAQTQAQVDAQRDVVQRLHNGSRPEEIAQARANLEMAKADSANAKQQYDRIKANERAVSKQELDAAKATYDVAAAKVEVNQKALDLAVIGPRKEDIAQAEAQLRANEAQLSYLQQQLADAKLVAPRNAIVRTRLLEPGEMSSPIKPVFTLAITDPKWVRAYVSETDLGKVHPGMPAAITVDSFPNRKFEGWVGFVSPVAEFTPKAVQTEELRTSLVYEVRVFVKDPHDDLRLGMPATVHLPLQYAEPTPPPSEKPDNSEPATEEAKR
jgi:HlyD family secretion protein